jgi:predicted ArsR family transcriptional regulator
MLDVPAHIVARACSHPLRAEILALLAGSSRSPLSVSKELGANLGQVSSHFSVLHKLGAIELVETKPRRGATEHFYTARWRAHVSAETL